MGRRRLLLGSAALIAVSGLALRPDPWLGGAIAAVLVCISFASRSGVPARRGLWISAATVSVLLALAEVSFFIARMLAHAEPREEFTGNYASSAYFARDPDLGYAPLPGAVIHSRKLIDGRVVYEVDYSIGQDGLRVTASTSKSPRGENCLIFFGCSYTFGEGLSDDSTLPWLTAKAAGPEWRVYNFSFHGYGPHQMLAAIESGRVRRTVGTCAERQVAVLQYGIEMHLPRMLGHESWDPNGPWYESDGHGNVVRRGSFDQRPLAGAIEAILNRGPLSLRWALRRTRDTVTASEIDLFVDLLATARRSLQRDFPGIETHLLLVDDAHDDFVIPRLRARGIEVHPIRQILPGWTPDSPEYLLAGERHPNKRYNLEISAWVARSILGQAPRAAEN